LRVGKNALAGLARKLRLRGRFFFAVRQLADYARFFFEDFFFLEDFFAAFFFFAIVLKLVRSF